MNRERTRLKLLDNAFSSYKLNNTSCLCQLYRNAIVNVNVNEGASCVPLVRSNDVCRR